MRGVHCSWVEMGRIRQQLAAEERGDQEALAKLRCVDKTTVSTWRTTLDLVDALNGKVEISQLSHVQPSHVLEVARTYRKRHGKKWSEDIKDEIAELVDRCEAEELTVEQLKEVLTVKPKDSTPGCTVDDLGKLVEAGKRFGTIYADPPWQYGNQSTRASTDNHYGTMPLSAIAALPVPALAAETCHLHLWTTNGFLRESFDLLDSWGFVYKSVFVWCKPKMGIGNYWRVSHEFLLLGVKGDLVFADHALKSWEELDRAEHSAKPERVREFVERASPGPYLELFGRKAVPDHPDRPGWTVWGNEISRDLFTQDIGEMQ